LTAKNSLSPWRERARVRGEETSYTLYYFVIANDQRE